MAKVAFVAHCLLNQNSRTAGGAYCPGVYSPFVEELRARDWRVVQMPCPELAFAGLNRFWAVREQYDTPAFRRHCRRIVVPVASAIAAHLERGDEVVLVGVEGSPTMGVHLTSSDGGSGGKPVWPEEGPPLAGAPGVLVEELLAEIGARGIPMPRALGVTHDQPEQPPDAERALLGTFLEG
jgi:predicted secreted protein